MLDNRLPTHGGDDLEDDFIPDDLVALSDPEEEETEDAIQGPDADINAFLSPDEEDVDEAELQRSQAAAEKKRKRREKEKEKKAKKQKVVQATESIDHTSIAAQPPVLLSDYLSSMQAKTFSKMSGIELTDIQIPGTSLPSRIPSSSTPKKGELSETKGPDSNLNSGYDDMDGFQKLGPACGLYNQRRVYSILFYSLPLPTPLKRFSYVLYPTWRIFFLTPHDSQHILVRMLTLSRVLFLIVLPTLRTRLAQRPKSNGAPTLIFVAGAALRVADATRILKDKKLRGDKGGEVAKLFARHFKLEEHITYLKRTKFSAAVGTPGRLGKLLCDSDALSIAQLTHIILDISHRDAKKRCLLDIPETRDEVFKSVLGCPKVLQAIRAGKIQVVLL
ncbi:hypothetical protein NLI96_g11222 [Meripilus lineatus]|uniref:Protein CMS1 n=1 Tax=Meripilus lineatus TaxID=2056292 RepID=A0AAD5YDH1_9APHY|nr:hypothetical protein NLI96_g11222 [Physisporinus lineatus]